MVSLKYDNERLQQLIQQKGINPSVLLNQQNTAPSSSTEHRLSLGDPAGLGTPHKAFSERILPGGKLDESNISATKI